MVDLVAIFTNVTIILLFTGLGVFGATSLKYRSIKSFHFQLSMVFIALIIGEIIDVLFDFEYVENPLLESIGSMVHVSAMAGIAIVFWARFVHAQKTRTKLVDEI